MIMHEINSRRSQLVSIVQQWSGAVRPWGLLALVFPALIAFNLAFLLTCSSPTPKRQLLQAKAQTFAIQPCLFQSSFLYGNRNPNTLFGSFYYTMGAQLAAEGQLLPAESMLYKAVRLFPDNAYIHLDYAVVLTALQKYNQAMPEYQKVLSLDPKSVQAAYSLGLLYDRQGDMPKAIDYLKKALSIAPGNPLINYDLGVMYARENDYANSAKYSRLATLGVGSQFSEAFNNYGYALAQLGQYEPALAAIEKSLHLKPGNAATLDSKGFVLYGLRRYADALAAYQEAVKADPSIPEVYLHLGQTYEQLNAHEKALKAYETYLQLASVTPDDQLDKSILSLDQVAQKIRTLRERVKLDLKKPVHARQAMSMHEN